MIDHDLMKRALDIAVEKSADYADIFVEQAVYNHISADDRKIDTDLSEENGIGIRVVINGKTNYAFTNSFEESEILKLAAYVRDAAGNGSDRDVSFDLRKIENRWAKPFEIDPVAAEIERKMDIVKTAEEKCWTTPHASQVTVRYRDHKRQVALASTLNGNIIEQTLGLTEFVTIVYVEKNGVRESGHMSRSFYGGLECLTGNFRPEKFAEKAGANANIMLTAKDCPRGEMPVIFAPGGNGILFHESCGHGMEADLVEKGSNFAGLIDKSVASPLVTLVDDGTLPGYPGSFEFDDEGNRSQKTVLIENGILRNYMHSSITARKFDVEPTGSARRESFMHPPIPRMRNTYILAGETDPKDIIKDTKFGLLAVDSGGGGQVNVITGEFITSVKLGYLIEDGQITAPVRGASIIGRGIDALKNIDMIGNDLEIIKMSGRCGKGQEVPVGVGMPTVRVKSLTVGGTGDAV